MKTSNGHIDTYINTFPPQVRTTLLSLKETIQRAAPEAEETIKYGIPTFVYHGNLVHFAAYKHHIGFYPTPSAIKAFQAEVTEYKQSKGAIQFPLNAPLPLTLISKMVKFRVRENKEKTA